MKTKSVASSPRITRLILLAAASSLAALTTLASPLDKERVPAEAKWLIHWDLDSFRNTKVGEFVATEILDKQLAKPRADLKLFLDFDLDWKRIRSFTAFGSDYQSKPDADGVLLIHTDLKVREAVESFFKRQTEANSPDGGPLTKLSDQAGGLYDIKKELLVAFPRENVVLLSKSRPRLERAADVVAGKQASLKSSTGFSGYPNVPNSFFFLGLAEALGANTDLPPQAKVLQMADGGRVLLGEKTDQLFLQLALKAKTADVSKQIQDVLQGLVALLTLSQQDNPDLQQLAKGAAVSSQDNLVTLNLQYPVAQVIEKIAAQVKKNP